MNSASTMSLRPSGIGRYFVAAFMAMWLVGWIVGEVFAIAMAGVIFTSIAGAFPERLPAWSADLVASGGLAFALLFLLVWLTFWTIGGIAALMHLMRSVSPRYDFNGDALAIVASYRVTLAERQLPACGSRPPS